jgi:Fe-S cluster assembly protein SufB
MSKDNQILHEFTSTEYKYGFETIIENDSAPKGLNEDIVRFIFSQKK